MNGTIARKFTAFYERIAHKRRKKDMSGRIIVEDSNIL